MWGLQAERSGLGQQLLLVWGLGKFWNMFLEEWSAGFGSWWWVPWAYMQVPAHRICSGAWESCWGAPDRCDGQV